MTEQRGTNRANPYMRWLYIVGGTLILIAFMIFSTGSVAADRLGVAVLQIGSIALIGAAVTGGVTWQPKQKTPYYPWPAGWYSDPNNTSIRRWWTGERWTDQTAAPQ